MKELLQAYILLIVIIVITTLCNTVIIVISFTHFHFSKKSVYVQNKWLSLSPVHLHWRIMSDYYHPTHKNGMFANSKL